MTESYIQDLFAERIGGRQYGKLTAIYKFEKIKRAKRAAMTAHPGAEILDLGVGEPGGRDGFSRGCRGVMRRGPAPGKPGVCG